MKIVVDTGRIIAALLRDSISRKILFNENFNFICPDHTISEIDGHKEEIIGKSDISENEFSILLAIIFEKIDVISKLSYEAFLNEAKNLINDLEDVPFLALCLAIKAEGIWTEDKHFEKQNRVKIFKTKDIIKYLENTNKT
ncbi:hypothetical protein HY498_01010 [Candidatus Woesearchaeota archaeon]|nr:hypothetical protein [Candidatus Woesearchaeota archaeon]